MTLTVTSEPLGVTIGTNETIIVNELTYIKKFIVSVADSAGVAKPDVNVVVSLDLPNYRKGQYVIVGTAWDKNGPPSDRRPGDLRQRGHQPQRGARER